MFQRGKSCISYVASFGVGSGNVSKVEIRNATNMPLKRIVFQYEENKKNVIA